MTEYERIDIMEAREGDEIFEGFEWVPFESVVASVAKWRDSVKVTYVSGGTHTSPYPPAVRRAIAEEAEAAADVILQTKTAHHAYEPCTLVTVALETGKFGPGAGPVLTVRNQFGDLLLNVAVAHASRVILSSIFSDADVDAILSRLAETN